MHLPGRSRRAGVTAAVSVIILSVSIGVAAGHPDEASRKDVDSMMTGGDCLLSPEYEAKSRADHLQRFADELNLSGQQQQDIKILTSDYANRLRDLAKQMRASGEKLAKTRPDDTGYWPLAQEVSKTAGSSAAETVILLSELREKIHAILTPEQRTEWQRLIETHKAQCKRHHPEPEQPSG